MPKVSFILPAYKRRFLREAIASILAQTYRDFELVVVDDCSPEDLKSVVDGFRDERLSYHRNETNIGGKDLVAAWNRAMEYARGEWCVLASDDDVWLSECLEDLMKLTDEYPKCDLFHARCAYIDVEGRWTGVASGRLAYESQIQMAYQRGALRSPQQAPDFMFRLSSWRTLGGFVRFPLAWHSDDATWMLLAKNGCVHTSKVSMCYRNSGINLSSSQDSLLMRKLDANFAFLEWTRDFVGKLIPNTEEEQFLLSRLYDEIRLRTLSLVTWEISQARLIRVWLSAVCRKELTAAEKRVCLYQRFPIIKAIRMMLPRKLRG